MGGIWIGSKLLRVVGAVAQIVFLLLVFILTINKISEFQQPWQSIFIKSIVLLLAFLGVSFFGLFFWKSDELAKIMKKFGMKEK